ncbi:hypothetical protein SAMN04488087_0045 [Rhodothermus profundi]|uniref:Uncharacterized protein n=1 Tax=Rhodothermus profundi TaxID=633813 RepID=A0A1M6P631_9BACT|nr:hypothetical protein SAMN04488087_0045 [Rhodothermus profundi]
MLVNQRATVNNVVIVPYLLERSAFSQEKYSKAGAKSGFILKQEEIYG